MSLNVIWPTIKVETPSPEWACMECEVMFEETRPRFLTAEDLDTHRREVHGKDFEGDISLKGSRIQKMKRKIFDAIFKQNKFTVEE